MYGELPIIKRTDGSEVSALPVQILEPPKLVIVRLPTDAELTTYLASEGTIRKDLGRGRSKSEPVRTTKQDAALLSAILLELQGDPLDEAETKRVFRAFMQHEVIGGERDGQHYIFTLDTPFGQTTHTLKLPTEKQKVQYARSFIEERALPHGGREIRYPISIPVELYSRLCTSTSGYENNHYVPANHKRSVINVLISTLSELDPVLGDDPN